MPLRRLARLYSLVVAIGLLPMAQTAAASQEAASALHPAALGLVRMSQETPHTIGLQTVLPASP